MSECEIYFLGKLIWTKLLKKNSSQTYPWLSLRFPNLSPNGSVKQLRLLDPGVSEERIVSLLVRKRFGECTLKLKILGNRNIRNPETPVGSSTTTLVFFRYKKHILMIVDASCVWISCAYYMEIYDNGPLPWECKIRGPNISTYGSALLGKITKRCSSHFLRTWILFWGDFFLGTKMSKKELSDLRIWNDRYMTERLKPLIPEDGIFDTKNPSSATAGFCFWATPPQKKTRKKNTKKNVPPKQYNHPMTPTHPKTKPPLPALPGNPGKMHDEVKREYAADEKMASSQPWELRSCGDFMPFWKPKKLVSLPPQTYHPQKRGLSIEEALLRGKPMVKVIFVVFLIVWKTRG